jgi:hypothetical protein
MIYQQLPDSSVGERRYAEGRMVGHFVVWGREERRGEERGGRQVSGEERNRGSVPSSLEPRLRACCLLGGSVTQTASPTHTNHVFSALKLGDNKLLCPINRLGCFLVNIGRLNKLRSLTVRCMFSLISKAYIIYAKSEIAEFYVSLVSEIATERNWNFVSYSGHQLKCRPVNKDSINGFYFLNVFYVVPIIFVVDSLNTITYTIVS